MAKIRIVYGSETGNTESIANLLDKELKAKGHEVQCESAAKVSAKGLGTDFDCVLLGASLWGTDEIELQSDFQAYEDSFSDMDLNGKKCGAFTSGDSNFELFCKAVDFIEEKYKEVGAEIITDGLRIEGDSSGNEGEITAWAETIHKAL